MGQLHQTDASLRFFGDDLDPQEITRLLGGAPTVGVRKGGVWRTSSGAEKTAYRGQWRISVERRSPGDLDAQIAQLFAPLTSDVAIWRGLSRRFQSDVFCGLFLNEFNEGISLSPETLAAVGLRGLSLDMDIYERDERRGTSPQRRERTEWRKLWRTGRPDGLGGLCARLRSRGGYRMRAR